MTERTDRELLELAAKAAGIRLEWDGPMELWQPIYFEGKTYHAWDPLLDDGDALRLAADLHVSISFTCIAMAGDIYAQPPIMKQIFEPVGADIRAATRRAIVRAAAAMAEGGEHG